MVEASSPLSMAPNSPIKAELNGNVFSIWCSSRGDADWGYVVRGRLRTREGQCLVVFTLRPAGPSVGTGLLLGCLTGALFGWLARIGLVDSWMAAVMWGLGLVPIAFGAFRIVPAYVVKALTAEIARAIEGQPD